MVFPAAEGYTYFFKHTSILTFNLEIYDPIYLDRKNNKLAGCFVRI
jgi:hypothetical protein